MKELYLRLDRRLYNYAMPPINLISILKLEKEDLLIGAAGFEKRSIASIKLATMQEIHEKTKFLIFEYLPHIKENKVQEIKDLVGKNSKGLHFRIYNREDPGSISVRFAKFVNGIRGRIFIDISGMSKLLIVQIINLIAKCNRRLDKTSIIYTMAGNYPPTKSEVAEAEKKMTREPFALLSSGVFELCIVPDLSSIYMAGQPIRLVVFPSFNTQQLSALRTEIQASYFSIINGVPYLKENAWRKDKIRLLNNIEKLQQREEHDVSTFEYSETLLALLSIYNKYGDMDRILIAPTGSKMQTVAVGILRCFLKDIQIVYPAPRSFPNPKNYTTGATNTYRIDLDSLNSLLPA